MKLLFLVPYLPSPPKYGGQRRIHGLVTRLARTHQVSVIGLTYPPETGATAIPATSEYCEHVVALPETWHRVDGHEKRVRQLRTLLSPGSWEAHLYRRPALQKALDEHLAQHAYDAIIVEFAFMAQYTFNTGRHPRPLLILDEHNIEYDLLRRTASSTGFARKLFHAVNWRKLRIEEARTWRAYDGVAVTSVRDERLLHDDLPTARTAVVPNGVDIEGFCPRPDVAPAPRTLLFFGAMNYYPNTDAALFFANSVMPLVRLKYPDARLRIVGDAGGTPVRDLTEHGVEVVGFVDDVREEIARAAVVVAPLRIGGGTRLKILEAMSMAKPIVATNIGAEGIDVAHGRDILLADEPDDLAAAVSRLFDDPQLAARMGAQARDTAVGFYSWEASAAKLEQLIETLKQSRGRVT
jgi:polysaccharide biosynthesis protein PslH